MRKTWMLVLGVGLIIVAILGLAGTVAAGVASRLASRAPTVVPTPAAPAAPSGLSAAEIGEMIYVTGRSPDGPVSNSGGPVWFRRMGSGCAICHGADGRGRTTQMMGGATEAPDIRYTTLTQEGSTEPSASAGPWTEEEIIRAVREGFEPNGELLRPDMPRWTLTNAEASALLAYLKELR